MAIRNSFLDQNIERTLLEEEIDRTQISDLELIETVKQLIGLSGDWSQGNNYCPLARLAHRTKDAQELLDRLQAELIFYRNLYEHRPQDKFRIYPTRLRFKFDDRVFPTIVLAAGREIFGCADFGSWEDKLILEYIQGLSSSTNEEQRVRIGKPWFEAFMDRTLEAYKPLHGRIGLALRIDKYYKYALTRRVRDRYFKSQPRQPGELHDLNPERERVKRILG